MLGILTEWMVDYKPYDFDIKTKTFNNKNKTDEKPPFDPTVKNGPITATV